MELDFGGLAKGYAARQVARMLQKSGAVSVLVNLGRSSFCASRVAQSSQKLTGAADLALGEWPIGVAHPDGSPQCPVYFVLRPGWSLSTSGTSERQFDLEGRKLSHILDPRSGLPLEGIRSATVIAPSGLRAEMVSKLLFFQFAVQSSRPIPRIRGFDWVHLDVSRAGVLAIHSCFARTPCLLPSSDL
jgi:thiamine biosynthesis lipoprotein